MWDVVHVQQQNHCFTIEKVVAPPSAIFMGIDKNENEDLIKWGWPEDVWFHVDKVSSAHVYLRLQSGQTVDDIPPPLLEDCAQLVKANSIKGNKMNNVDVVYTMWANLKKTAGMDVGQVGFHRDKEVRKIRVEKRSNEAMNRLNKTKEERHPDLRLEREERDRKERDDQKQQLRHQKEREKEEEKRKMEQSELRNYSSLMKEDNMRSNHEAGYDSDDFMWPRAGRIARICHFGMYIYVDKVSCFDLSRRSESLYSIKFSDLISLRVKGSKRVQDDVGLFWILLQNFCSYSENCRKSDVFWKKIITVGLCYKLKESLCKNCFLR